jgi:hypothetical protein
MSVGLGFNALTQKNKGTQEAEVWHTHLAKPDGLHLGHCGPPSFLSSGYWG